MLLENPIEQSVRKPGQEDAASAAVNDGIRLRVVLDGCHGDIEGAAECNSQPRTLRLVRLECLFNVSLSLRREESRLHRDLRRSRTSAHGRSSGRPARTSVSRASRRRSSSDR